jgi:hypothetical protein
MMATFAWCQLEYMYGKFIGLFWDKAGRLNFWKVIVLVWKFCSDNLYVVVCPIDVAMNINIPLWVKLCFLFFLILWLYVFWFYVSFFCIFKKIIFPFVNLFKFFFELYIYVCFLFACLFQQNLKISCFAFLYSRFFL